MSIKKDEWRWDKPIDKLIKRQALYAGPIIHKYYQIPGKYHKPGPNEIVTINGENKRTDITYLCKMEK